MKVVVQDTLRNEQWVGYEGSAGFSVGRSEACTVRLPHSRFVSRTHLLVDRGPDGWQLRVSPGASSVRVDDGEVNSEGSATLRPVSQVRIAEYVLTLIQDEEEVGSDERAALEDLHQVQRELHAAVLQHLDLRRKGAEKIEATPDSLERINALVDGLMHGPFRDRVIGTVSTRDRLLALDLENRLLRALAPPASGVSEGRIDPPGRNVALEEACDEYVARIVRRLGVADVAPEDLDHERISRGSQAVIRRTIAEIPDNVRFYMVSRYLKKVVCDMVFGLGPLQDLLDAPDVTEIMIVGPERVYVERGGRISRSNRTFLGEEAVLGVIERIVAPLGRRIDRSQPLVDARLPDGSRVNAVIAPLALSGPCLTIRRFPKRRITVDDLVAWGSLTPAAAAFLEACVRGRRNIVVAGGTGSGKTTLLNVLSSFIPEEERIVTIEDAAELRLDQEHVVSLETRPANVEGKGAFTIRDLVRNALRMRPDRVVVGECRGAEAFDMLQAMNTGHDGSLTTIHSNSSEDTIARIETMCLQAADIPIAAIRRQIAQAVDLIVYVRRFEDGSRRVTQITEVTGLHPHTGEVEMLDIMALRGRGRRGRLRLTGTMPSFLPELVERGLVDLDRWFGDG